jgi:hypothetical protein
MIDILWKAVHQLWEQRNGRVHGVDSTVRTTAQSENVRENLGGREYMNIHTCRLYKVYDIHRII